MPSFRFIAASFLFAVSSICLAQTNALLPNVAVIGSEGGVVTAISNPSAVLQFGAGTSWCTPFVASSLTLPAPVNYGYPINTQLCAKDPAPNQAKQLVAQRGSANYTVTFTDANNVSSIILIPALAATNALLPNVIVIGSEGGVVTAISNPSAALQFGTGVSWCTPFTAASLTLPAPVNYGYPINTQLCATDPAPNQAKELVAQRGPSDYTVNFTDANNVSSTILVPALALAPVAPLIPVVPPVAPVVSSTPACGQATSVWWEIAGGIPSSVVLQPGTSYMQGTSSTCIVAPSITTIDLSTGNLLVLRTAATQYAQLTRSAAPAQVTSIEIAGVSPWVSSNTYQAGDIVSFQGQFWYAGATGGGVTPGSGDSWIAQPSICNTISCP